MGFVRLLHAIQRIPASTWAPTGIYTLRHSNRRPGAYTSARLKTQGLFSFQYGRFEVRALVPEAQGFWPAAWLMGNNIANRELADLRRTGRAGTRQCGAGTPDWNQGSIHGTGFHRRDGFGHNVLLSARSRRQPSGTLTA